MEGGDFSPSRPVISRKKSPRNRAHTMTNSESTTVDQVACSQHDAIALLDCVDEGLVVVDSEGCIELINNSAATLLQLDRESTVGRPLTDTVRFYRDPADAEPVDLIGETARQGGNPEETDHQQQAVTLHYRDDLVPRIVRVKSRRLDSDPSALRSSIVLTIREITDVEAYKGELLFKRFAFDRAADAIFWADPDKRFIYVNDAACDQLGYTREELLHMSVLNISTEHDSELLDKRLETLKRTHHLQYESLHRHKSGDLFPVEISLNLMHYKDRTFTCGIVRDTRFRKQAEEALRASEQTNRFLKDITIATNEASGPNEALRVALERLCEFKHWPIGHIYFPDPDGSQNLVPSDIWHLADADRYQALVDVTEQTVFPPDAGLPGRIFSSKKPGWIEDIGIDDGIMRITPQSDLGIHDAFAFPVLVDHEVVAVMEFFAEEKVPREDSLLDMTGRIGVQLGIVFERQRAQTQISQMHSELLETARQAGRAELATSVLHDVGNVLTSVNVSARLFQDKVLNSGVSCIRKAVGVMEEHLDDLGTYLTQDERGRHLPQLFIDLSKQMSSDEQIILEEVKSLVGNIDHIKTIVATQQSHAKNTSGVVEQVSLTELLEKAILINSSSMKRHSVKIIRQYDDVAPVLVDSHKLLQIMVNLISNAKYSCMETGNEDCAMTVRLLLTGEDCVSIDVQDNGVGIPSENLTRIFAHGFTTRKDGHGFGLHSAAIAAKEMGGILTPYSDGLGTGATFTVEFPYKRAGESPCTK